MHPDRRQAHKELNYSPSTSSVSISASKFTETALELANRGGLTDKCTRIHATIVHADAAEKPIEFSLELFFECSFHINIQHFDPSDDVAGAAACMPPAVGAADDPGCGTSAQNAEIVVPLQGGSGLLWDIWNRYRNCSISRRGAGSWAISHVHGPLPPCSSLFLTHAKPQSSKTIGGRI